MRNVQNVYFIKYVRMDNLNKCKFNKNINCIFAKYCKKRKNYKNLEFDIFKWIDFEQILLDLWIKKIIKKENIKIDNFEAFEEKFKWYFWQVTWQNWKNMGNHWVFSNTNDHYTIIISKNKKNLIEGVKKETAFQNITSPEDFQIKSDNLWELLWYPKCCTENFSISRNQKINTVKYNDTSSQLYWLLNTNDFICPLINNTYKIISHFCCSYDCKKTIKIIILVLSHILKNTNRNEVKKIFDALNISYFYLSSQEKIFIKITKYQKNKIFYKVVNNKENANILYDKILQWNNIEFNETKILIKKWKELINTANNWEVFLFDNWKKINKELKEIMFKDFYKKYWKESNSWINKNLQNIRDIIKNDNYIKKYLDENNYIDVRYSNFWFIVIQNDYILKHYIWKDFFEKKWIRVKQDNFFFQEQENYKILKQNKILIPEYKHYKTIEIPYIIEIAKIENIRKNNNKIEKFCDINIEKILKEIKKIHDIKSIWDKNYIHWNIHPTNFFEKDWEIWIFDLISCRMDYKEIDLARIIIYSDYNLQIYKKIVEIYKWEINKKALIYFITEHTMENYNQWKNKELILKMKDFIKNI